MTHKYVTPGKRSPLWSDGTILYEGVVNRLITKIAAKMLVEKGWEVLYTVCPDDHTDVSLRKRVQTSNKHYAAHPDAFQVSIHSNGVSDTSAHGTEVWTWPGQSPADPIADVWLEEIKKQVPWTRLRTDKSDGDGDKESKFKINSVNCPSILIESFFHTNYKECQFLLSAEGQYKVAKSILNTAERIYYNN